MMLDLRSIFIVGAITSLIVGLLHLAVFATGRFGRWPLWWGCGNLLVGLGGLGVAARGAIPDPVSVQFSNLLSWSGCLLLLAAIRSFAERPQQHVDYVVAIGLAAALLTLWQDPASFAHRVVLMSSLCAACDLVIAFESVHLARRRRLTTAWMLAGLFVLTSSMFLVRVGLALSGSLGDRLFASPGPVQGWLAAIGAGFVILRSMSLLLVAAEQNHAMLMAQAVRDPLTGAMNRGGLDDWLKRQARGSLHRIGVLLIDIDDFKQVNDGHGHATGDLILQMLADVAFARLRPTDVLARQGGDEFIVILPGLRAAEAGKVAERLRIAFNAAATRLGTLSHAPTLSIGVAEGDLRSETFEAIAERADAALYLSKRGGRDRVQMHSAA